MRVTVRDVGAVCCPGKLFSPDLLAEPWPSEESPLDVQTREHLSKFPYRRAPGRMYGGELTPNAVPVNEQLVIFYVFAIRRGKSGR